MITAISVNPAMIRPDMLLNSLFMSDSKRGLLPLQH